MPEKSFNKVPKELLDLVESEDTALEIARICFENGIEKDEKIREIAYQAGRVLLGDLSPEKFSKVLAEKVEISSFLAGKIAREINDSIFYPVKESLATFYKEKITPAEKPVVRPSPGEKMKEESDKPKREDIYREPIE